MNLENKSFDELVHEHKTFISSAIAIEPYFNSPFENDQVAKDYLQNNPEIGAKLLERFGNGVWLNRSVRVLNYKNGDYPIAINQLPEQWMRDIYIDIFDRLKKELNKII